MEERATGIILRTHPLTETSLIVRWLTAEAGRIDTVAKGARRARSVLRGKLDLFYLARFSYARSRRSELHTLREVELLDVHGALRRELGALRQASYAAALIMATTESGTPMPEIFDLLKGFLARLTRLGAAPWLLLAFEVKLLGELGLQPQVADAGLTPGPRRLLESCVGCGWEAVDGLRPGVEEVRELGAFLQRWLAYHIGRVPRDRVLALGN